jgi:hypothetical protein
MKGAAMREPTEAEKQQMRDDARAEFPNDAMMQEIHYVRQLLCYRTQDMSTEERVRFYNGAVTRRSTELSIAP